MGERDQSDHGVAAHDGSREAAGVPASGVPALADSWPVDLTAPEVGVVWDLCLTDEYDRDRVVRSLAEWLGPPDGLRVLDCACGTGFPAFELHRLGYRMTCTDGSAFMLRRFRRNAEAAGVPLRPRQARWEELHERYEGEFDVVLCRGCSLVYAGTFERDVDPDWSAVERSVSSFVACLRPGGRLYVDTTPEQELNGEYPRVREHPPRMIDGRCVELREELTADQQKRLRRWQVQLRIDGAAFDFERRSHYVSHPDFVKLLQAAGLEDVARVEIAGEPYAVFVGQRP
jgi:SAM-dependent methyltransferase